MVAYRYYLGPPRLVSDEMGDYWAPPPNTVGWVDVAPLPGQGQSTDRGARGCGFYAVAGDPLPSDEYDLLATGDLREIAMTGSIASTWEGCTGYRPPVSGMLLDALWEHLTDGSAPDGESGPMPLMPTTRGALDLHLGGHSLVRRERFRLLGPRAHRHASRVLEALHRQYEAIEQDEQRGRARSGHALRVADYWREKYRLGSRKDERESAAWRVLLPGRARGRVRRLIPHETTITESFDQGDSTTLGPDLSWTELSGDWSTLSSQARVTSGSTPYVARADSDLSSVDHYSQVVLGVIDLSGQRGVVARKDGTATETYYHCDLLFSNAWRTFKRVSGSFTELGSRTTAAGSPGDVLRISCDGSSISRVRNGSVQVTVVDTAIAAGLRCGIQGNSTTARYDDFEAADLAVATTPIALLAGGLC